MNNFCKLLHEGVTSRAMPGASEFHDTDELLSDGRLSKTEKRAILASWASDARAPENAPTLRQIDCGGIIPLAEVLGALRALDEVKQHPDNWRVRRVMRGTDHDDDDDPPPCPVAALPRPKPPPSHFTAKPLPLERRKLLLECA